MPNSITWMGGRMADPIMSRPPRTMAVPRTSANSPVQSAVRQEISAADPPAQQTPSVTDLIVPIQTDPALSDTGMNRQGPPPSTEPGFIPYYLASNIGRNVRAEFIVGSDQYVDKTGRLIEVGINYFVLEDVNSRTHIMCDLYSVKFVTILQNFGT